MTSSISPTKRAGEEHGLLEAKMSFLNFSAGRGKAVLVYHDSTHSKKKGQYTSPARALAELTSFLLLPRGRSFELCVSIIGAKCAHCNSDVDGI